jgi:putative hydrolase of the HAD superfamily
MIKVILFDCDGLIIRHEKYFTVRLAADKGVVLDDENQEQKKFFNGIFLDCETGKADLKQEISKNLGLWHWEGKVEDLMDYWFSGEAKIEGELKDFILNLKQKGYKCFISTNNEKYRAEYLWSVAGLKNIFDGFFASCNVGHFKEDQGFWEKVYQNLSGLEKHEILVWDDDMPNVEAASKFGFNSEFYSNFGNFKKVMQEKYQI